MKSLPEFNNLALRPNEIIVVSYPLEAEITSLIIDKKTKQQQRSEFPYAKPMVVAKVGAEASGKLELKRGDFVFIKEAFTHQATLLAFDEERRQANPIFIEEFMVLTKVVYAEDFETEYEEIAEKLEVKIKEKQDRLQKAGLL
jgi:hypothetical protein